MKPKYERPMIVKLQTGMMNKFGSNPLYSRNIRQEIDGVSLDELTGNYGSPLFVYSERNLRKKYRTTYQIFATRYPQVKFGWSYKTNYLQAICAVMHQEGAMAEVVSEFEYDKARKLGIPGDEIIFNGPNKSLKALEKAALEGAMINLDHFDEIVDLEQVAKKLDKQIEVGIRVNMDTGIHPQWSRFGFNIESGEAFKAGKRIANGGLLKITGLHSHIGTFILEPDAYAKQVEKMVIFSYELEDKLNFKMDYLDIGGGLPSRIKLKGTYLPPDVSIPPIDLYAEKITDSLYKNLRPGDQPVLILESGRGIVDEAGYLISSIMASKRLPDGRKAYVADAGINLLFTSFWYRFNIEMDRAMQGMAEASIIYGPMCMNIDIIDEGSMLPPLDRGTRLILSPVGAYCQTQSFQFIEYRPNAVMITEKGQVELIREAEDLSDIERREKLPPHLQLTKKK
jgi:diaminopimelate decarboxylase